MGELEFSYKETAVLLLGNCLFATGQKEENSNILSLVAKSSLIGEYIDSVRQSTNRLCNRSVTCKGGSPLIICNRLSAILLSYPSSPPQIPVCCDSQE